eukprot:TRINITY_DN2090_c0_g1_i5.p1 TRINITY_DN2090_c0_g1~~TRINITY_DN2090_c0_g1_i5.p1  ORF type:complete len:550 (+),score=121.87 TRINITY_DN2090_c0_g1_i5:200-1849(+)
MNHFVSVSAAVVVVSLVKVFLFLHAPYSTDFDVHRNWIAITSSLPITQWYYENTSQWTLDYPPLFAWFERVLGFFAPLFDDKMLTIREEPYSTLKTILFQKLSVSITDVVLFAVLYIMLVSSDRCRFEETTAEAEGKRKGKKWMLWFLFLHPALLMIDHIHFQYNGVLIGLFLWSIHFLENQSYILAACVFAVTLNMKHLFMCAAPVFAAVLLREFCWKGDHRKRVSALGFIARLASIGGVVVGVCAVSFGPFVFRRGGVEQFRQILSRLFPFGRGLTHAYWAPNIWALYNFVERISLYSLRFMGKLSPEESSYMLTRGFVGEAGAYVVMPNVRPTTCLIFVALASLLTLWCCLRENALEHRIMDHITFISMSFFMFGWHVHEKAVLPILFCLGIMAFRSPHENALLFKLFSLNSTYSFFPLLLDPRLWIVRLLLFVVSFVFLPQQQEKKKEEKDLHVASSSWLSMDGATLWFVLLLIVEAYSTTIHPIIFRNKLPFFPLMLVSVICALPNMWVWACLFTRITSIRLPIFSTSVALVAFWMSFLISAAH